MDRRRFFKTTALGSTALTWLPGVLMPEGVQAQGGSLGQHCRAILDQNLLKPGETLVVATAHEYDIPFITALVEAAADIGASGAHVVVVPKKSDTVWDSGIAAWHWQLLPAEQMEQVFQVSAGAHPSLIVLQSVKISLPPPLGSQDDGEAIPFHPAIAVVPVRTRISAQTGSPGRC